MQFQWAYFVDCSPKRPPLVRDHFLVYQGWVAYERVDSRWNKWSIQCHKARMQLRNPSAFPSPANISIIDFQTWIIYRKVPESSDDFKRNATYRKCNSKYRKWKYRSIL